MFNRKPTEEEIEKAAKELILDQLQGRYSYNICRKIDAPAKEYAQEVIKEQMERAVIKEEICQFLDSEMLDKIVKKHMNKTVNGLISEQLVEKLVKKINNMQLEK